jgi:7,8-dihydropterin-6-yl-methyl-4-(beta-D-ribofuranosyl)aminobenzene 5'-phosphate synthase
MKTTCFISAFLIILFFHFNISGQNYSFLKDSAGLTEIKEINGIEELVTICVIYDNYRRKEGVKPDWGYSILIEGLDKSILFDTGANPGIFESNFRKLGIDGGKIDYVVISHEHGDHNAGIQSFARIKNNIPVIIPFSFSDSFKKEMEESGLHPLLVKEPAKICSNLYSSGEFAGPTPEQALVLNTKQGLVVMTGCSHPGIIEMLKQIKTTFHKNIYMVFGGFHLLRKTEKEMMQIIKEMKELGVVKCGATHCTGDKQTRMIREAYGENFIELGAGNVISIQ